MKQIKFILINETSSPSPTPATLSSLAPDFRHSHIVDAAGLSRSDLIKLLQLARSHYPEAKILSLSEIHGGNIHPSDSMNQLRKELSDYP